MTQPQRKPRVFVGSSQEAIPYAEAVHSRLRKVAQVLPWFGGTFEPNQYTMESLEKRLHRCDFGIFVFAPDDVAMIRGKHVFVTRDNTVFEAGLFGGKLGRNRVFCIVPQDVESSDGDRIKGVKVEKLHLLSDLNGLTLLEYEYAYDGEYEAAVSDACTKIARIIGTEGFYSDTFEQLTQNSRLAMLFWEYSRLMPITRDSSVHDRYNALYEAIRNAFVVSPIGDYSVTHVALYARRGNDGMQYVAGNMDEGSFYEFPKSQDVQPPIVIVVHNNGKWAFTHAQNVATVSVLCYPLGDDHVVSIYLTGNTVLTEEQQKHVVERNAVLLRGIKRFVGGEVCHEGL